MAAVPIRSPESAGSSEAAKTKLVESNQKAIDTLPLNSGVWKVKGIPGLYVRARAKSKSFMLARRIEGDLVRVIFGPMTMKKAKERAMEEWGSMERKQVETD